ncbi:MAG: GTPase Era [Bacillota bacterium]
MADEAGISRRLKELRRPFDDAPGAPAEGEARIDMEHRSGFVAVIGKPNVGKSTLVNRFAGMKISITSPRPQTTRNKIKVILTGEHYQVIFLDTPGIHFPRHMLGKSMVRTAEHALGEADAALFVLEAPGLTEEDYLALDKLRDLKIPILVVVNKIDLAGTAQREKILRQAQELGLGKVYSVSALNGQGIKPLEDDMVGLLPAGPQYYPEEMITEHPERFFAAEFIREQILAQTFAEIPHSIVVRIEEMRKRQDRELYFIRAVIFTEKESQKGIIIGADGKRLKEIATKARENIEIFLGTKVFLQIWIKVRKNWRNSPQLLKQFGLTDEE